MKGKLVSYADHSADVTLMMFLHSVKEGFYLDIGANDPTSGSMTKLFYEMGWKGINFEPLPKAYEKLLIERPRDLNINMAAGDMNATVPMMVAGGRGENSSIQRNHIFAQNGEISVQVRHLTSFLERHMDLRKQEIHFCNIDTAGYEPEVLNGIDFDSLRPWMLAINAVNDVEGVAGEKVWGDVLAKNGYRRVARDKEHTFYMDNRRIQLAKDRMSVETLKKRYDVTANK